MSPSSASEPLSVWHPQAITTNSLEPEGAVILGLPNLPYDPTHSPYIPERELDT